LGQLERAARVCYDFATAYSAPLISGKDSMFNDFKGFDENSNSIKVSVPPTLLASSIGIVEDVTTCISMEPKEEGDLVYLIGKTKAELGAGEFDNMLFESFGERMVGNRIPQIAPLQSIESYRALSQCIQERLVASAHPIDYGGLAVGLAKSCIAGKKGMRVELQEPLKSFESLFSESLGRILVTIAPKHKSAFESAMKGHAKEIGIVKGNRLEISLNGKPIVRANVGDLEASYKKTFGGF